MTFNGFISYSHAADGRLAPAVQRGLHRLAKPWHRRRALWIFRDQTGLSVTPALWSTIQSALDRSDYFVLLASPEAAHSAWVNREIEHWVSTKSADQILPVVTDGDWRWDPERHDFAEDSTAVPDALRGVFTEEPLYLDLRWARDDPHLSLRHSRFRDAIAQLAAPMHGVSKDDLEGEDVRQHRRAARLRWAAVTALLFLSLAAVITGALAVHNAAEANASALETQRQQQLVVEQSLSAAKFADEARRQESLALEQEKRASEAGAEAGRQELLVRQQRALVKKTSAEVDVQLANADRAATRARQQERLAKRQSTLAAESARQMRSQAQRTKEQEKIAAQQRDLAEQAAADARAQEQKANAAGEQAKAAAEEAKAAGEEATKQKANADEQQRIAIGRRLITEARETISEDPQYALRLGVAGQRISPDAETRRAVTGMATSVRRAGMIAEAANPQYGPNGLLASNASGSMVALWNTSNQGNPVRLGTIDMSGLLGKPELTLSKDGRILATLQAGTVIVWNVADPSHPVRAAALPEIPLQTYRDVTFSPDGRTLLTTVSGDTDAYAMLWDVSVPDHPAVLSSLTSPQDTFAQRIAFSGDGRTLLADHTSGMDVWDISDPRKPALTSGPGPSPSPTATATSNPGIPPQKPVPTYTHDTIALSAGTPPLLAVDAMGGIELYDMTEPAKPELRKLLTGPNEAFDFSSDGRLLAAGGKDGTAIVWDLTGSTEGSLDPRETLRVPVGNKIESLEFSPDGKTLITSDETWKLKLWNIAGFGVPQLNADVAPVDGVAALSYAADGRSVTTASNMGDVDVWDVADPAEPVRRATVDFGFYSTLLISPDGRIAAVETEDDFWVFKLIDLSDPDKPATLATIDPGLNLPVPAAFSPDGNTLVIGGQRFIGGIPTPEVQVWDLTNRSNPTRTATISNSGLDTGGHLFSPDGHTIAMTQSSAVSLWDLSDRTAPTKLSTLSGAGHTGVMAFSSDGHTLATVDPDRAVLLWDVTDRSQPRRLSALPRQATAVTALAFSRDGQTLATAAGGTVMLWDFTQRTKPVRAAEINLASSEGVGAMAFSRNENTLTIGGHSGPYSGRLSFWDLTALDKLRSDPSKLGCTIAGRGLTREEWAQVVPELPYRSTCPG